MSKINIIVDEVKLREKSILHKLPCDVKYDGPAEVNQMFCISEDGTASFRGRRLHSKHCDVPEGYTGVMLKSDNANALTDTNDSIFSVASTFEAVTAWGWDSKPSPMNFEKLLRLQNALHKDG